MVSVSFCDVVVFILILVLDISDLLSDWLFYVDVSIAEQGLVYGRPEQGAVISLLVFSIIGTITFIFEICNLGKEIFTDKPWINVDLITAIVLWVEDIPQITINVFIALCREDPISVFQLVKASVIILGIIIRIIISSTRCCRKWKETTINCTCNRPVAYHVFIILGLILNFVGAVAIFILTQTHRDPSGKISYEVPDKVFEKKYPDDRYFKNVSIYFHHPSFDVVEPNNVSGANWMRLIKINSVRNLPEKTVMFLYEYQGTATDVKIVLWENNNCSLWEPVECYTMTKADSKLTKGTGCDNHVHGNYSSIIFKFSFIPPDMDSFFRKLIFGDIKFNAKFNNHNGFCEDVTSFSNTNTEDGLEKHASVTVHYYRTAVGEDSHVVVPQTGDARFYRQKDFLDITTVWKTGWRNCETKGRVAPHIDRSIQPPCDRHTHTCV